MAVKKTRNIQTKKKPEHTDKKFFVCEICGIQQNMDQSIHIKKKKCVTCYTKQQVHQEFTLRIENYIKYLKERNEYTIARKRKIATIMKLNDLLVPNNLSYVMAPDIPNIMLDIKAKALKLAIESLEKPYIVKFDKNFEVLKPWLDELTKYWKIKKNLPEAQLDAFKKHLKPIVNIDALPLATASEFLQSLKKTVLIPSMTVTKHDYKIKRIPLDQILPDSVQKVFHLYQKQILRANGQSELFNRFILALANKCQFQTKDDKLMFAVREYMKETVPEELEEFGNWMLDEINTRETAELIPNISIFIMDHYEKIFYTWFTSYLPFDKHRFSAEYPKAMSRTDFAVKLEYLFTPTEITQIRNALISGTEALIRSKAHEQIEKIKNDPTISAADKPNKITQIITRLTQDLLPENLKKKQDEQANSAKMVARYLILNCEKAFNMVLDKIIRYHYKRLKITTPVQFITNVSRSSAEEKKKHLEVIYWISSREW